VNYIHFYTLVLCIPTDNTKNTRTPVVYFFLHAGI
jgi:hypothetical protein